MHVRHDLVAGFDEVVGHTFGADFSESEVGLGIDQAGVDGHAGRVDNLRVGWNLYRRGSAYGGDLSVLDYEHAVLDGAVGDGEKLGPLDGDNAARFAGLGLATGQRTQQK